MLRASRAGDDGGVLDFLPVVEAMNILILNRDFRLPDDRWYQLAPMGEFPHAVACMGCSGSGYGCLGLPSLGCQAVNQLLLRVSSVSYGRIVSHRVARSPRFPGTGHNRLYMGIFCAETGSVVFV